MTNPDAIANYFNHIIDGVDNSPRTQLLQSEAERAWDEYATLKFRQGRVAGIFHRESVSYALGSLPGVSILLDIETDEGHRQAILNSFGSPFTIESPSRELPQ